MEQECSKCDNLRHVLKGGKWTRCSCLKGLKLPERLVEAGIDAESVNDQIHTLKGMCESSKYLKLRTWFIEYKNKVMKGGFQRSLWLNSSSLESGKVLLASLVKVTFSLNRSAKVYHLSDLLMEITDNRGRQTVYQEMIKLYLMCLDVSEGSVNEKAIQFSSRFMGLVCRRRLREGKAVVMVTNSKGEGLKKRVGVEVIRLLQSKGFDRIEC
ncbi:MAG TPA: hypothetical protein ENH85_12945 [Candidatus Scalindua sp.]|nr:hypothetical protein [Candidatus Scalindua sp.]